MRDSHVCPKCHHNRILQIAPGMIPIDGRHVKELVGPEPEAPYR